VKLSAERGSEPRDQPVRSAYSRVAVFSHSPAALFLFISFWAGVGSGVHKTVASVIAIAESFVSLHIHPTPQDDGPPPRGEPGLRSHPHASRRAIYARSCKRFRRITLPGTRVNRLAMELLRTKRRRTMGTVEGKSNARRRQREGRWTCPTP
jgi:hypothetical protein